MGRSDRAAPARTVSGDHRRCEPWSFLQESGHCPTLGRLGWRKGWRTKGIMIGNWAEAASATVPTASGAQGWPSGDLVG